MSHPESYGDFPGSYEFVKLPLTSRICRWRRIINVKDASATRLDRLNVRVNPYHMLQKNPSDISPDGRQGAYMGLTSMSLNRYRAAWLLSLTRSRKEYWGG